MEIFNNIKGLDKVKKDSSLPNINSQTSPKQNKTKYISKFSTQKLLRKIEKALFFQDNNFETNDNYENVVKYKETINQILKPGLELNIGTEKLYYSDDQTMHGLKLINRNTLTDYHLTRNTKTSHLTISMVKRNNLPIMDIQTYSDIFYRTYANNFTYYLIHKCVNHTKDNKTKLLPMLLEII